MTKRTLDQRSSHSSQIDTHKVGGGFLMSENDHNSGCRGEDPLHDSAEAWTKLRIILDTKLGNQITVAQTHTIAARHRPALRAAEQSRKPNH